MRIVIERREGRDIRLILPSGLLFNRFAARFVPEQAEQQGIAVTKQQAEILFRELNRYRRTHPGWVLAEVKSADGNHVKITL